MDITYDPEFELLFVDKQPISAGFLKMLAELPDNATLTVTRRNGILIEMRVMPDFHTAEAPYGCRRIQ